MRVMGFPGRYVQGPGAIGSLGELARESGCRAPMVLCDDVVERALGERVPKALAGASLPYSRLRFAGECTHGAIDEGAAQAAAAGADLIIGLGGGKTIDTAKGIARQLGCRLMIAPTVASNDSPTSRLIVIYDASHRLVEVQLMARNPDVVLVDTQVVVEAPQRFFRAGIGDALSKRYEAAQCASAGGLNFFGGTPPDTAGVLANRCHDVIVERGEQALADVARRCVTPDVESVIEATVLLSGLGFESGGLSISHALLRGLSALPAAAASLHGEQVAWGTIVQLVLEERPAHEQRAHRELLLRLGLPDSLGALGFGALSAEEIRQVATLTVAAPYITNFSRPLTADDIARAIEQAESAAAR